MLSLAKTFCLKRKAEESYNASTCISGQRLIVYLTINFRIVCFEENRCKGNNEQSSFLAEIHTLSPRPN